MEARLDTYAVFGQDIPSDLLGKGSGAATGGRCVRACACVCVSMPVRTHAAAVGIPCMARAHAQTKQNTYTHARSMAPLSDEMKAIFEACARARARGLCFVACSHARHFM